MGEFRTAIELLGGGVGGVAQALVGHPLDLVKVRLQGQAQSGTAYAGMMDCVVKTGRQEGLLGLYKVRPTVRRATAYRRTHSPTSPQRALALALVPRASRCRSSAAAC